jgi:predicted nucleic acid-binding protein
LNIIDAGVVVELLVGNLDPVLLGTEDLGAPHLIDTEVVNALRRLVAAKQLGEKQATAAFTGFTNLSFTRFGADILRPRMWELRHNLSAYDATYVALAERIGATALLTTDSRLSNAPGLRCQVTVL